MSDGLRLPEGSNLLGLHICKLGGLFSLTIWAKIPGESREYKVNMTTATLQECLLEAGKFLDEGLGLDIQLQVKMPPESERRPER